MTHLVNVMEHQQMFFILEGYIAMNTRQPDSDQEIRAFYLDSTGKQNVSGYKNYDVGIDALKTESVKELLISQYNNLRDAEGIPTEGLGILKTFAETNLLPGEEVKRISDDKAFLFLRQTEDGKNFVLMEKSEDRGSCIVGKEELSWEKELPKLPDESEILAFLQKCLTDETAVRLKGEISGVWNRYVVGTKFKITSIEEERRRVTGYFGYSNESVSFKNIQIPTGDTI